VVARHARSVVGIAGLGPAALACALACSTATVRREDPVHREYPAGVAHMRWRTSINPHPLTEPRPEECATGALVGRHLVLGTRGGTVVGVDVGTGAVAWSTRIAGGVDGSARYDSARGQVYVGSDDGNLYALDPEKGAIRWSAKFKGPLERAPEIAADRLYLATAADRVYAVDPKDGRALWQYERDTPEGFTIHGYAAPVRHRDLVYAGFSDGYLAALRAGTGELVCRVRSRLRPSNSWTSTPRRCSARTRCSWRRSRAGSTACGPRTARCCGTP
jgi:outer membrane protein assembly factor BamB